MTNLKQRIVLAHNDQIFVKLLPSQRQILLEKVKLLDLLNLRIEGLLTVHLQRIRGHYPYIEQGALAAMADHFPNLIEELHQQEIEERA